MRLGICRRPVVARLFWPGRAGGLLIPGEAQSPDGEDVGAGVNAGGQAQMLSGCGMAPLVAQFEEKGQAVSSLRAVQG